MTTDPFDSWCCYSGRGVPTVAAIRVLIVDDHPVVREGTRQVLERDPAIEVVGEAGTVADAVRLARHARPDVVLLDLALPDQSGIEGLPQIRSAAPRAAVLVLSAYDEEDYVVAAMEAGAAGYLLKTMRARDMVGAIQSVHQGQVVLHPTVAEKLRRSLRANAGEAREPRLSPRELAILRLAAKGHRNKEIAAMMSISVRTVEGHLSHILTKIGASSRTEAVMYGAAHHWFPPAVPPDEESDACRQLR